MSDEHADLIENIPGYTFFISHTLEVLLDLLDVDILAPGFLALAAGLSGLRWCPVLGLELESINMQPVIEQRSPPCSPGSLSRSP